jgi:hypothetical protein
MDIQLTPTVYTLRGPRPFYLKIDGLIEERDALYGFIGEILQPHKYAGFKSAVIHSYTDQIAFEVELFDKQFYYDVVISELPIALSGLHLEASALKPLKLVRLDMKGKTLHGFCQPFESGNMVGEYLSQYEYIMKLQNEIPSGEGI